jgi:histidinol dehydrogenase
MLPVCHYPSSPLAPCLQAVLDRRAGVTEDVSEAVRGILRQVRTDGDLALAELTRRFDRVDIPPGGCRVPAAAIAGAVAAMPTELHHAVVTAVANVRAFHEHQRAGSWFVEAGDGVVLGKKVTPVDRVGICVPGGEAPLFSSLIMAAVPAQVAGVGQLAVVTPPRADGLPHAAILAVCGLLGIDEVYAVGGAQAVAALAYGTATIRPVDLVVGPGSPYTVAAQQQVFGRVGVAMLPGPSEIVVVADAAADPTLIAADLLSQAEHGWGVASVLITDTPALASAVAAELERQLATLPRRDTIERALAAYGALVVVPDLGCGFELLNRIAPEHAELQVAQPWEWLDQVRHAGAVFLGPASTEPVGDYFAGTNHILPTNGAARYASSLGVGDFVKTCSIVSYTSRRLATAAASIVTMARAEGLEAHARAVLVRQGLAANGAEPR